MSIFGPYVDGKVVRNAVRAHLEKWLATYLAEADRRNGFTAGYTATPKAWVHTTEFDRTLMEQLPAILIICNGISPPVVIEGNGRVRSTWIVGIGALVSAGGDNPQEASKDMAMRYGWATAAAIMQRPSLGDPNVQGVTWEDHGYNDVPANEQRSMASCRNVFAIEYTNVMDARGGPVTPDPPPIDDPPGDWPTVAEVDITIDNDLEDA